MLIDSLVKVSKLDRVVLVLLFLIFFNDPRLISRIVRGVPNVQKQIEINKMEPNENNTDPVSFDVFKQPLFWPGLYNL